MTWDLHQRDHESSIINYELSVISASNEAKPGALNGWGLIGEVGALALPMACTMNQLLLGASYYFKVCAITENNESGIFSDPCFVTIKGKCYFLGDLPLSHLTIHVVGDRCRGLVNVRYLLKMQSRFVFLGYIFFSTLGDGMDVFTTSSKSLFYDNGPFARSWQMVQGLPCWMASYALGHPKQREVTLSWWKSLCFGGCCILLPSSMADFVPCDGIMQMPIKAFRCLDQ